MIVFLVLPRVKRGKTMLQKRLLLQENYDKIINQFENAVRKYPMSLTQEQIKRRRTFAIISHPDAGKTTLTEKLLLYGGAIQLAGSVKGKATARHAVSDWMELEKQRGISITSSVMQFEYEGYCINILDTPGHQDFS